jgi:hypothetical protein
MKMMETDQAIVNPATSIRRGPRIIDVPEYPLPSQGWTWGGYQDTREPYDLISIRHTLLKRALRRLDCEYVPCNRQVIAFYNEPLPGGQTRINCGCREDQNLYSEIASPVLLFPDHDPRVVAWPESRRDLRTTGWGETDTASMTVARNGWLYWAVCRMQEEGIPEAQQRVSFRETPGKSPGSIDLSCMYWSEPA